MNFFCVVPHPPQSLTENISEPETSSDDECPSDDELSGERLIRRRYNDRLVVHIGKRGRTCPFMWNFHNDAYYNNRETLIKFILGGKIVDEKGNNYEPQEFLNMAFSWKKHIKIDTVKERNFQGAFRDIEDLLVLNTTKFS